MNPLAPDAPVSLDGLLLSDDQKKALEEFNLFILDPVDSVFVLRGFAGCGKSTLVRVILDQLPRVIKAARLIQMPVAQYHIELTATTNKAAEALAAITGSTVSTIHSKLGLRVITDFHTQETKLQISKKATKVANTILFIDEASFIDRNLLEMIFKQTSDCKIIFIGDPAQLSPVKSKNTPVFDAPFRGAALREVMRQAAGNPIIDLATKFRETVETGKFFSFTPDGYNIQHLPRDKFEELMLAEFTRPDWRYHDSKVLAWTNKVTIAYNHAISDRAKGSPELQVGDYAICNSYVHHESGGSIKTDSLVLITRLYPREIRSGVAGRYVQVNYSMDFFMPEAYKDHATALKAATAAERYREAQEITNSWIDLRAAYACTINKSQGSTYDKVFIDLDDIRKCNSGEQIARMLYVAVSRARFHVYFTGDLV